MLMFEPIRKYATFRGRARRREYWLWQIFIALVTMALSFWLFSLMPPFWQPLSPEELEQAFDTAGAAPALWAITLFSLFIILPSLAVSVRRLHDSDKSGWWLLLGLIPGGAFVLFIFYLLDGTRGPNRHGPDPKGRTAPRYD